MTQGSTTRRPTRGVRTNNPGNIRHARGTRWQGAAAQQGDREFVTFVSAEMGVRALVRTLLTYYKQHRLKSVRAIINRWAPPIGDRNGAAPGGRYTQDTSAYVNAVCAAIGRQTGRQPHPDTALEIDSVEVMRPLVVAIIAHENAGYRYPDQVIDDGLRLAGIANARPRPATQDGQVQGALIAGTATAAGGALELVNTFADVRQQLEPVAYYSEALSLVLVVLAMAGVAVTIWSHIDRKRKTLS